MRNWLRSAGWKTKGSIIICGLVAANLLIGAVWKIADPQGYAARFENSDATPVGGDPFAGEVLTGQGDLGLRQDWVAQFISITGPCDAGSRRVGQAMRRADSPSAFEAILPMADDMADKCMMARETVRRVLPDIAERGGFGGASSGAIDRCQKAYFLQARAAASLREFIQSRGGSFAAGAMQKKLRASGELKAECLGLVEAIAPQPKSSEQ